MRRVERRTPDSAMALPQCPDCGAQVSDRAPSCPACGHPIRPRRGTGGSGCLITTAIIIGALLAVLLPMCTRFVRETEQRRQSIEALSGTRRNVLEGCPLLRDMARRFARARAGGIGLDGTLGAAQSICRREAPETCESARRLVILLYGQTLTEAQLDAYIDKHCAELIPPG